MSRNGVKFCQLSKHSYLGRKEITIPKVTATSLRLEWQAQILHLHGWALCRTAESNSRLKNIPFPLCVCNDGHLVMKQNTEDLCTERKWRWLSTSSLWPHIFQLPGDMHCLRRNPWPSMFIHTAGGVRTCAYICLLTVKWSYYISEVW